MPAGRLIQAGACTGSCKGGCGRDIYYTGFGRPRVTCGRAKCLAAARRLRREKLGSGGARCVCERCGHSHRSMLETR